MGFVADVIRIACGPFPADEVIAYAKQQHPGNPALDRKKEQVNVLERADHDVAENNGGNGTAGPQRRVIGIVPVAEVFGEGGSINPTGKQQDVIQLAQLFAKQDGEIAFLQDEPEAVERQGVKSQVHKIAVNKSMGQKAVMLFVVINGVGVEQVFIHGSSVIETIQRKSGNKY